MRVPNFTEGRGSGKLEGEGKFWEGPSYVVIKKTFSPKYSGLQLLGAFFCMETEQLRGMSQQITLKFP